MAYDEGLAERVRRALTDGEVEEKKMFGGLCFLVGGNMALGIVGEDLMVRVGADAYQAALDEPHAREMDFTGKPMRGLVYVGRRGFATPEALGRWVERGLSFARSLPAKGAQKKRRRAGR